jgi:hypothetical protein
VDFASGVEGGVSARDKIEPADHARKQIGPRRRYTRVRKGARVPVAAELDDGAVAEVLKCVGKNDTPGNLDREQLKTDINAAWDFCRGYEAESSKRRRTQLRNYAGKLRKAAQNLSDLLDQSDSVAISLRKRILHRIPLNEFRERLHGLVQLSQVLSNAYSGTSSMSRVVQFSPLYFFLGDGLKGIFEKHFKQPAKRTRSARHQLEGPFIRFATAVAARLGNPVTGETISDAMTEVTKGGDSE